MANDIQLKRSSVAGRVPSAANVLVGEPVINLNDKIIFTKDGGGNVIVIGAGTTSNVIEGSNLYFSNARVSTAISTQTLGNATFSSDVNVRGELFVTGAGGDEGGQITLAPAVTNSTLAGQVVIDVFQNKLRFFEKGGSNRGAYIDLSTGGASVGTSLISTGSGTITSVAGVSTGAVSNAQLATATVTSQTLTNATFSANVTADRFIANNNNNGENYRVGDDAWIGDTNVADTVRIKGLFDAAQGYILFGNNDGNKLGRNGLGALTYSAGFAAANVVSTGNISAGNAVVTNALTAGTLQTAGNINANNLRVVTNSSVGTVVSGTWNGSSISTTYTDAKVTSVNGQTGAATGFATTANTLAQFASTTSSQLAGIISDETGTGSLVFASSPTLVTPVIGAATGTSLSLSGNIIVSTGNASGSGITLSDDGDIVDMNDGFASMRFTSGVKVKTNKFSATDAITLASTGTLTATGNVNAASAIFTGALTAGTLQTAGNVNANNLRVVTNSSLGTVVQGTWNGASISTTYTDAKVTSVNGQVGAATGFATTANALSQFASTTSAQLAGVISDETGTGSLVFANSPTLATVLATAVGSNATPALRVSDTLNRTINFLPNVGGGSYNPIVTTNDSLIYYTAGGPNNGNLVIAPWASYNSGIKLDAVGNTIYLYGSTVASNSITLENNVYYRQKNSSGVSSDILGVDNSNTLRLKPVSGGILHVNPDGGSSPTYLNYNTTGSVIVGDGTSTTSFIVNKGNINATTGNISGSFTAGTIQSTGNLNVAAGLITGNFSAGNFQTAGNVNANNLRVVTNSSLGTVVQGTWNGSSISTTFTDAKVTSVNGQTGAATGFATTANSLSQFASTTSAQLATLISDETGSGALVFGTSPAITTSLTTPSSSFDLVNTTATTVNFARAATTLSVGSTSGTTTVNNDLVVTGNVTVNGTTTTVNAVTVTVDDKNLELGSVASPTDVTAEGGGITLKGATDKTLNWVGATGAWTSSEDFNLLTGKVYEINGTSVLSSTTLGSGVVNSSLTSVGTLGSLNVTSNIAAANVVITGASRLGTVTSGTWNGSSISTTYTDAKVTSVNGQTGAATGFATTANTLAQFASTTSAQLATLISDETGSGALVFATTPTLVTPVLGLATGTSVMLSANVGAAAGNVSGNFTAGNFQTAGNVNAASALLTGSLTAGTLQTSGNVNANNLRVVTNSSLGTVVSGTWNGASISTTYTDAKVVSVNGSTGAVTGLATTAGTLAQFGATTSSQLAGVISDETGSGALVFATTPTLVTPVLGLATGTSVMLSANIGAAAGNVSGNFTAGNYQTAGNVNSASGLFTGSLTAGTLQTSGNVNASSLRVTTASSLGTVQSGTWNGSSISTTYTDAKVTTVAGSTGAISNAMILSALLTVDGASSGLDADLLDGLNSSVFLRNDVVGQEVQSYLTINNDGGFSVLEFEDANSTTRAHVFHANNSNYFGIGVFDVAGANRKDLVLNQNGTITWSGNTVWHAGNDGAGSGLDADLLDGQSSSYYLDTSSTAQTKTGNITLVGTLSATTKSFVIKHPTKEGMQLRYGSLEGPENGVYVRGKLKGSSVIDLPEYWVKLVDPESISVQLTPIGRHQKLFVEDIIDNSVIIGNDGLFAGEINCFYTIFAERVDVGKLQVEI